ncbi:MAG: double zinc ribbon domain-containing protein [Gemmobacter sp.]
MGLQALLRVIYPPRCLSCETLTLDDYSLCGPCWRDTPFIAGLVCDKCGIPLPGEDEGQADLCDDCLRIARPWSRGRAAFLYEGNGRAMVLALKHGDRLELARPLGAWLARAAAPLLAEGVLVAPVPLHRLRLLRRRYNQAALLSAALAREAGLAHLPDLLVRTRRTRVQDGADREARFLNLSGAIAVAPRHRDRIAGRQVLLVDDVMTSGATLAAAADACLAAGAGEVSVAVLARVPHRAGV